MLGARVVFRHADVDEVARGAADGRAKPLHTKLEDLLLEGEALRQVELFQERPLQQMDSGVDVASNRHFSLRRKAAETYSAVVRQMIKHMRRLGGKA